MTFILSKIKVPFLLAACWVVAFVNIETDKTRVLAVDVAEVDGGSAGAHSDSEDPDADVAPMGSAADAVPSQQGNAGKPAKAPVLNTMEDVLQHTRETNSHGNLFTQSLQNCEDLKKHYGKALAHLDCHTHISKKLEL